MIFPDGKRFAFSVFDDTDVATLESVRPVYELLESLGMRTTKTVWPFDFDGPSAYRGSHTLEHPGYREFVVGLQRAGFEIAFHGASMMSSERATTLRALERFREILGHFPRSYAAHSQNLENLYWGRDRFTSPFGRWLFSSMFRGAGPDRFEGHIEGSPYFWGDVAAENIQYVRNLTFDNIDLLQVSSHLPYRSARRPYVRAYFSTADADNVEEFNQLLCERNQRRLERQSGVCIVSTHFGKGFVDQGRVHPETTALLTKLAERDGWFVPVSTLLDHLASQQADSEIGRLSLWRLEWLWFWHALRRRLLRRVPDYKKTEIQYLESGD